MAERYVVNYKVPARKNKDVMKRTRIIRIRRIRKRKVGN